MSVGSNRHGLAVVLLMTAVFRTRLHLRLPD